MISLNNRVYDAEALDSAAGITRRLHFDVVGTPQPAGSKRGFPVKRKDGRVGVRVADDNPRAKSWQGIVASVAAEAMMRAAGPARDAEFDPAPELWTGPLCLVVEFRIARIKGHFGTGRNEGIVKPSAPRFHTVKPDATKLLRGVEDALSGVVWVDDTQVVEQFVSKGYGWPEGARIVVMELAT